MIVQAAMPPPVLPGSGPRVESLGFPLSLALPGSPCSNRTIY